MFSALAYRLQLDSGYPNIKSAGSVNFSRKDAVSLGSIQNYDLPCVHVCRHTHASFTSKRQSLVSSIGKNKACNCDIVSWILLKSLEQESRYLRATDSLICNQ